MSDDFNNDTVEKLPTLDDALAELSTNTDNLPSPDVLYGLSGLSPADMTRLEPVWAKLDPAYRRILMQMLVDASESNFELHYEPIGKANLNAAEPEIRQAAIEVLWEDESIALMKQLIQIATSDPNTLVRAEAAKALGRFVLLGELGDLPEAETKQAQDVLIAILNDSKAAVEIQRQALESIANCTRKDVIPFIEKAYTSEDDDLRSSAIVAMGRTCDSRWENNILTELESGSDSVQLESVKAAGELQLDEAIPFIIKLVPDAEREMLEAIIWALGEIGGKQATRTLEMLAESAEEQDDEDLIELIDDAIGNASLASGDFTLMGFDELD